MGPPSRLAMIARPVKPALTKWVEQNMRKLISAQSENEFVETYDAFFARHVNITVNGTHLASTQYAAQLLGGRSFDSPVSISFSNGVEVLNANIPTFKEPSLVGLQYEASFDRPFLVRGSHAQANVASTLNVIVAQDKTLPPSVTDRNRIVSINQVLMESTV